MNVDKHKITSLRGKTVKNYTKSYMFMSILTFIGGFLDVYTFITRGGVFANTQTTNLAKLGYNIATHQFDDCMMLILPIISCILGASVSTILMKKEKDEGNRNLMILEILILVGIGFITNPKYDLFINSLLSFLTSFQLNLFRKYGNLAHNTTISTGNLRQVGELFGMFILNKTKIERNVAFKYATLVFMFVVGATMSVLLTTIFQEKSIWFCSLLLSVLIVIGMDVEHKQNLAVQMHKK